MQQPPSSEQTYKNEYTEGNMKRLINIFILLVLALSLHAQNIDYAKRYRQHVSRLGPAGLGIGALLDNWKKADSTNVDMLAARVDYYLAKARSTEVVTKDSNTYLGQQPVLALKDSTGTDVYYYQLLKYEDELFGKAVAEMDNAVALHPDMLDFRFMKANAYISYEGESPDLALAYLFELIAEDNVGRRAWEYDGKKVEKGFFKEAIQEYCATFYTLDTPASMEAFLALSKKMSMLYPDDAAFITNVGSYHMKVKNDAKTALKFYTKAVKKNPKDYPSVKNAVIAARKIKNVKQEKKYLTLLAEVAPEAEKAAVQARLKALDTRKK